jgi:hypothetical protein
MVFTDWGFSIVRDWMLGRSPSIPSGMLVGVGSGDIAFSNLRLGSPLDPTRHVFSSQSGIGFTCQLEHLVNATDIITGSVVREIGMIAQSGGNLFFRSLIPEIELFGSAEINSFLIINIV